MKRFGRLGLWAPALGLAVIIIAVALVASGPRKSVQIAPVAPPAAAPKPHAFIWHDAPETAAATPFKDASGAEKRLGDFAGQVLVVNFWATWCGPCIKEMPTLDALQAKLGGPSFAVLAISEDQEGAAAAEPFIAANGWKNLALYTESPGHFARDAKLNGLPTSIIVDKQGREVGRVEGEINWLQPELEAKLKELMAQ